MKNIKKISLSLLLTGFLFCGNSFCQSLNVNNTNGNNAFYNLQDVRKITFENSNLVVSLLNGNSFSYNLATLSNYVYDESSVQNLLDLANAWNVKVYPNPTQNSLFIEYSLKNNQNMGYSLLDLSGKELIKQYIGNQGPGEFIINVSLDELPSGSYILQVLGDGYSYISKINKI
jgi:hypothetical protein